VEIQETAELLIKKGAFVNALATNESNSVTSWAALSGNSETVELLIEERSIC
jgi:ankyrin repeat protein